jgi:hypothetical protein
MGSENERWWFAILQGLAGAYPQAVWGDDHAAAYSERERMKFCAADVLQGATAGGPSIFRAQWWLVWAYAHWWRAREALDQMDADDFDQAFDAGMDFKRYLAAWLWSVGVSRLDMTADDLEAVRQCTGVGPMPHLLLPLGCSMFLTDCFSTDKTDAIPARSLTADTLRQAFAESRQAK